MLLARWDAVPCCWYETPFLPFLRMDVGTAAASKCVLWACLLKSPLPLRMLRVARTSMSAALPLAQQQVQRKHHSNKKKILNIKL
jgi:hypothetical protein